MQGNILLAHIEIDHLIINFNQFDHSLKIGYIKQFVIF